MSSTRVSKDCIVYRLDEFGIVVTRDTTEHPGGTISSDLHETVPIKPNCDEDTPEYWDWRKEKLAVTEYNRAMDGIEALVLGHACAGIDITTDAYLTGIRTAVDGAANNI
jgi:hypothetical protein